MTQKRHYISVAIVAAAFVLASPAPTHLTASAAANSISVSGEAEVLVVPDEVILSLGVESFDKVLKTAKIANDDAIRRTIAVARGYGIPAEYVQTDYLGIEPRHRDSQVAFELLGYDVRKSVVIRLRDITKFESLLTDELDAGVTHVHMIEFRTTELRKYSRSGARDGDRGRARQGRAARARSGPRGRRRRVDRRSELRVFLELRLVVGRPLRHGDAERLAELWWLDALERRRDGARPDLDPRERQASRFTLDARRRRVRPGWSANRRQIHPDAARGADLHVDAAGLVALEELRALVRAGTTLSHANSL